jgi:hypothetical protein
MDTASFSRLLRKTTSAYRVRTRSSVVDANEVCLTGSLAVLRTEPANPSSTKANQLLSPVDPWVVLHQKIFLENFDYFASYF